jgi:putative ABC transport system ATP-binding protein
MNEGSSIAISTKSLYKTFRDGSAKIEVLRGIDLEFKRGDISMLVGPSGCGKTTLLSVIAGTSRPDETTQELMVLGNNLLKMSQGEVTAFRSKHIGFIFQQFHLIPTLNCVENVAVSLLIQGQGLKKAYATARLALTQVGLADRFNYYTNQLSGGQQQRVAIARAIVHEPDLIICDEPTAALDAKNGQVIMELFEKIAQNQNRAVLIVTHDNRIFSHAHSIATMEDGLITEKHDTHKGHLYSVQAT